MLAIEDVLCELQRDHTNDELGLPPGFRFHPTDEELITFYLSSKVFHGSFCNLGIPEIDLNRCEPWELPDVAKMGEREWYFFNLRDRKYPTGLRTNRATGAGYWKATGKDRAIHSSGTTVVGMKKTLVFYQGRAPRGQKTKWVMHEYRLHTDFSIPHTCKEEWVICRIYHKLGEKKNNNNQINETPRVAQGPMHNQNLFLKERTHFSSESAVNVNYQPMPSLSLPENATAATVRGGEYKELMNNAFTEQFKAEVDRFCPYEISWTNHGSAAVYQHDVVAGGDGGMGFLSAAASDYGHLAGFEMVAVDHGHPIEETADSWLLDPIEDVSFQNVDRWNCKIYGTINC